MIGGLSTSLAGFKVATERLENSAQNLANINTTAKLERNGTFSNESFRPQAVVPVAQAEGGVTSVTIEQANPTLQRFDPNDAVAGQGGFVEAPNVDVAQELITQKIASYDAKANLKAIEVQNETFESLLDIFT